jgi:uncharacterized protein YrrD
MKRDEDPISWTTLKGGTAVHSADGHELGKVADVVADEQKDIFSGIVLKPGWFKESRFVPAELIDEITSRSVRLTVSAGEAHERLAPNA